MKLQSCVIPVLLPDIRFQAEFLLIRIILIYSHNFIFYSYGFFVGSGKYYMTIKRKIVFYAITILLVWFVIEAMAMMGHLFLNNSFFPKQKIKQDIKSNISSYTGAQQIDQAGVKWGNVTEVIHPYFGFVLDPNRNQLAVSDFGFDFSKGVDSFSIS